MNYLNQFNQDTDNFYSSLNQANAPQQSEQGLLGDSVDALQMGALSASAGLFNVIGADGIADSLQRISDDQLNQMSATGRAALQKEFITEDEKGRISLGDAVTDLDAWVLNLANVVGQFVPTAIPGGAIAKGVTTAAKLGKAGQALATSASMGTLGGAAATGQAGLQAQHIIENMADEDLVQAAPFQKHFKTLRAQAPNADVEQLFEQAKTALKEQIEFEVMSDPKLLVANFAASAIGDPIIAKSFGRALGGSLKASIAKGFVTEGASEFAQGATEHYTVRQHAQKVDPTLDPSKGMIASGLNEALIGGTMGGTMAAVGHVRMPKPAATGDAALDAAQQQTADLVNQIADNEAQQAANAKVMAETATPNVVQASNTYTAPELDQQLTNSLEQVNQWENKHLDALQKQQQKISHAIPQALHSTIAAARVLDFQKTQGYEKQYKQDQNITNFKQGLLSVLTTNSLVAPAPLDSTPFAADIPDNIDPETGELIAAPASEQTRLDYLAQQQQVRTSGVSMPVPQTEADKTKAFLDAEKRRKKQAEREAQQDYQAELSSQRQQARSKLLSNNKKPLGTAPEFEALLNDAIAIDPQGMDSHLTRFAKSEQSPADIETLQQAAFDIAATGDATQSRLQNHINAQPNKQQRIEQAKAKQFAEDNLTSAKLAQEAQARIRRTETQNKAWADAEQKRFDEEAAANTPAGKIQARKAEAVRVVDNIINQNNAAKVNEKLAQKQFAQEQEPSLQAVRDADYGKAEVQQAEFERQQQTGEAIKQRLAERQQSVKTNSGVKLVDRRIASHNLQQLAKKLKPKRKAFKKQLRQAGASPRTELKLGNALESVDKGLPNNYQPSSAMADAFNAATQQGDNAKAQAIARVDVAKERELARIKDARERAQTKQQLETAIKTWFADDASAWSETNQKAVNVESVHQYSGDNITLPEVAPSTEQVSESDVYNTDAIQDETHTLDTGLSTETVDNLADESQLPNLNDGPLADANEYHKKLADEAYAHSNRYGAKVAQEQYVKAINDTYADLNKDLNADQKSYLDTEFKALKAKYLAQEKTVLNSRAGVASWHIAGRNNFNAKQAEKRSSAADKAQVNFNDWFASEVAAIKSGITKRQNAEQKQAVDKLNQRREKNKRMKAFVENVAAMAEPGMNKAAFRPAALKAFDVLRQDKEHALEVIESLEKGFDKQGTTLESVLGSRSALWQQIKSFKTPEPSVENDVMPLEESSVDTQLDVNDFIKTPGAKNLDDGPYTIDYHNAVLRAANKGELSLADFKKATTALLENESDIKARLNKYNKKQLTALSGNRWFDRDTKKEQLVEQVFDRLLDFYLLENNKPNLEYSPFDGETYQDAKAAQREKVVAIIQQVDEVQLKEWATARSDFVAEQKQQAEAKEKALSNPETFEEYQKFIAEKGADSLSAEQKAQYDSLFFEKNKARLAEQQEQQNKVEGLSVEGDLDLDPIEESTHGKTGEPIFNVHLNTRLGTDTFKQAATQARKMKGGYWRGNFYFKSRQDAELFVAWLQGETMDLSDKQAEKQQGKQDKRVQRLTEMAESLEEKGQDKLNQDRNTNTQRRLSMAQGAIADAENQIRFAQLLKEIAKATENGEVELLANLSTQAQLQELNYIQSRLIWSADESLFTKDERSRRHWKKDVSIDEKVQYAKMPVAKVGVRTLQYVVEGMAKKDGYKQVARSLNALIKNKAPNDDVELNRGRISELLPKIKQFARTPGGLWSETGKSDADRVRESILETERLEKMGITNLPMLRQALRELYKMDAKLTDFERDPLQEKEQALKMKVLGNRNAFIDFFPTPETISQDIIDLADIEPGMRVLEPSAGHGMLADAARKAGADVDVVEIAGDLREILEDKGHHLVGDDFLDFDVRNSYTYGDTFKAEDGSQGIMRGSSGLGGDRVRLVDTDGKGVGKQYFSRSELTPVSKNGLGSEYDRIVMNPPFSNDMDIDHVRHAYTMLKPGGRLVAITSSMAGERSNKKNKAFAQWLDELGAEQTLLPENAFKDSLNPTAVRTKTIVIDKPESDVTETQIPSSVNFSKHQARPLTEKELSSARVTLNKKVVALELQKFANEFKGLKGEDGKGTEVRILRHPFDVTEWGGESAVRAAGAERASGAYETKSNTLYLFTDNIHTKGELQKTIRHELLVHKGLGLFSKANQKAILEKVNSSRKTLDPRVKSIWQNIDKNYGDATELVKAEEFLARLAETNFNNQPWHKRLLEKLADAFMGLLQKLRFIDKNAATYAAMKDLVADIETRLRRGDSPEPRPPSGPDGDLLFRKDGEVKSHFDKLNSAMDAALNGVVNLKNLNKEEQAALKKSLGDRAHSLYAKHRSKVLGLMPRTYLTDVAKKLTPIYKAAIEGFQQTVQKMDALRSNLQEVSYDQVNAWQKLHDKDPNNGKLFAELLHDATLENVDPSQVEYQAAMTESQFLAIKKKLFDKVLETKTIDDQDTFSQTVNAAQAALLREESGQRFEAWQELSARFKALPPEWQAQFNTVVEAYKKQSETKFKVFKQRIKEETESKQYAKRMLDLWQIQYEMNHQRGFYVPLQRFGEYSGLVKRPDTDSEKGETLEFSLFENEYEQKKWLEEKREEYGTQGVEITGGKKAQFNQALDGVSAGFMRELLPKLSKSLSEDVYQLYLEHLPDLSMRKHFIRRKGVKGYSQDAIKAFAHNTFHGAYEISKLAYSHRLDKGLSIMRDHTNKQVSVDDNNKARDLTNEFENRYDWLMNPSGSPLATAMTSFGFLYYLGVSPAAAMVNLSQTPLVAFPVLASRYGFKAAGKMLLQAGKELISGKGHLDKSSSLTREEQRAMKHFASSGLVSKSMAHDLAGIAEGGQSYNPTANKWMTRASYLFHHAERLNREATAMAAFRLARQKGKKFKEAIQEATDLTIESHFDYSSANRARYMQNDFAKVLLLFRQYSLNMTIRLWRDFKNQFSSNKAEAAQAKKQFWGMMGMTAMFAGAAGLPLYSVLTGLANLLGDDEDEPWNADLALRQGLGSMLGEDMARIVMNGLMSESGANIQSRVSLNNLWLREPNRDMDGRDQVAYYAEQFLGPVYGLALSAGMASTLAKEDHTYRAIEYALPKFAKDVLKAARYNSEGVQNLRGDEIIAADDMNIWDIVVQASGYSPTKVGDAYSKNSSIKGAEQKILARRRLLLNRYALAKRLGDTERQQEVLAMIERYNQANPEYPLSRATLLKSLKRRKAYSEKAQNGIVLNPNLQHVATEYALYGAQ